MTTKKKIIPAIIIQIILLFPISCYKTTTSDAIPLLNILHEPNTIKLTQVESNSSLSILRIGVMAPRYYLENYAPYFDPIAIGWNIDFCRNSLIYEALVQYNYKSGDLSPALATQWVVSKDGKHWTFDLRENVIFHDGSKFNASSVKWNFDRIFDLGHPAYIPPAPWISAQTIPFDFIEIKSEFRVTIHLKEPYAPFLYMCSFLQIASPNSFEGSKQLFAFGTGPYVLRSTSYNNSYQYCIFTRFPDYYQGLAPFEQIQHLVQKDFIDEIKDHSIDIIFPYYVIPTELKTDSYWSLNITQDKAFMNLGFINYQNSYLNDLRVRLAINYAIDKQGYIEKMNWTEFSEPMTNLIPGVDYPYNVTKANELLDQAGYHRGRDGYRFGLRIVGAENRHPEIIGEYLKAIGIWPWVERPNDWAAFWREGNYDLLLFGSTTLNYPDECQLYLHSSGPYNTGMFHDSIIDALIQTGSKTPVRQEREYYFNQLQPLVQNLAPYFFLTYDCLIYAIVTNLTTYIFVNRVSQICFNYSSSISTPVNMRYRISLIPEQSANDIFNYKNVEISDYPIYFPRTDCIVTRLQQKFAINITMSHNFNFIRSFQEQIEKLIQNSTNYKNLIFQFRYYYDPIEINGMSHEQLSLFLFDEGENNWEKLNNFESNSIFHFLGVKLNGRTNLIRFNDFFLLIQVIPFYTFILVPFFAIAIGGLIIGAFTIVIYNFKKVKYIKERMLD